MKLFGSNPAQVDFHAPPTEKKYTRFACNHIRPSAQELNGSITQHNQAAPVETPRRVTRAAQEQAPRLSLADQLHSEAPISTALLRRALPLRFSEINEEDHKLAKDSLAGLLIQARQS